jgi:serine/threonine protein kinase
MSSRSDSPVAEREEADEVCLGAGVSGHVYLRQWREGDGATVAAVKVYDDGETDSEYDESYDYDSYDYPYSDSRDHPAEQKTFTYPPAPEEEPEVKRGAKKTRSLCARIVESIVPGVFSAPVLDVDSYSDDEGASAVSEEEDANPKENRESDNADCTDVPVRKASLYSSDYSCSDDLDLCELARKSALRAMRRNHGLAEEFVREMPMLLSLTPHEGPQAVTTPVLGYRMDNGYGCPLLAMPVADGNLTGFVQCPPDEGGEMPCVLYRDDEVEIRTDRQVPAATVATIGLALASALERIHVRGAAHNDVKTANVLVVEADSDDALAEPAAVWLTDFGLLRPAPLQRRRVLAGFTNAEAFRPPGVIGDAGDYVHGDAAQPADMWGLGVILLDVILRGMTDDTPLFADAVTAHNIGDAAHAVLAGTRAGALADDVTWPPHLSEPMFALLGGLLAHDAAQRWTAAHAVGALTELQHLARHGPYAGPHELLALQERPLPLTTGPLPRGANLDAFRTHAAMMMHAMVCGGDISPHIAHLALQLYVSHVALAGDDADHGNENSSGDEHSDDESKPCEDLTEPAICLLLAHKYYGVDEETALSVMASTVPFLGCDGFDVSRDGVCVQAVLGEPVTVLTPSRLSDSAVGTYRGSWCDCDSTASSDASLGACNDGCNDDVACACLGAPSHSAEDADSACAVCGGDDTEDPTTERNNGKAPYSAEYSSEYDESEEETEDTAFNEVKTAIVAREANLLERVRAHLVAPTAYQLLCERHVGASDERFAVVEAALACLLVSGRGFGRAASTLADEAAASAAALLDRQMPVPADDVCDALRAGAEALRGYYVTHVHSGPVHSGPVHSGPVHSGPRDTTKSDSTPVTRRLTVADACVRTLDAIFDADGPEEGEIFAPSAPTATIAVDVSALVHGATAPRAPKLSIG